MLKRILIALLAVVAAAAASCLYYYVKDPNPERPSHIEDGNGFVQARGTNLYDGNGDLFQMKGVNLGNWFVQEFWMGVSSVGDYDTGRYTQLRGRAAMEANPDLSREQVRELEELYIDTYIQEKDFRIIADLGMNTVRIPFTCYDLTEDGYVLREDAFSKLDWAVEMCGKYDLLAIIDLHGAVGSQNKDIHSGDNAHYDLYGNEQNMQATCDLWKAIAEHFRGNTTVAAYDLLNEPRRAPGKYGGKVNFDFYDRLYRVVREADPEHLILIECFSFPINGVRLSHYDWENICMEYHIYNLTPFSQKTCLNFYKAMHNFMGYDSPVCVGEWNAFDRDSDWRDSFAWFDEQGWSFISWCYKANAFAYKELYQNYSRWGLYDLWIEPVDLSTASYEQIRDTYLQTGTEEDRKTDVYGLWEEYLRE